MQALDAVIQVYLTQNIPFAVFRYPNQPITLVAQYQNLKPLQNFSQLQRGFLIHPFQVGSNCPIFHIAPSIFTSNFGEVDLQNIPNLSVEKKVFFNETSINKASYLQHINQYKITFAESDLQKAIYSRIKLFEVIPSTNLTATFFEMQTLYKSAFCYLIHLPAYGIWLGASPERLLSYQKGIATTVALAGTKSNVEKVTNWGEKEVQEQGIVSTFIVNLLKKFDCNLIKQSNNETIQAGTVQHIKTAFQFNLSPQRLIPFLNALHPTPALSGYPQKEAMACISQTEIHHRQYYAGYLGLINNAENIDLYVNLRCAKITQQHTLAFVGGGITKDSDPLLEWQETEHKSETIGALIK